MNYVKTAVVLGASEGSGNIGDAVVKNLMTGERGEWRVYGSDCAIGDGSRPPGGNIPNREVAEQFGYSPTEKGSYRRFDAPSVQEFKKWNADACVITLGSTYKDHFADVKEHDLTRVLRACLELPLITARRFVHAAEDENASAHPDRPQRIRQIVFVGSYAHTHPFTNGTAYCAAKAGINMAARALGWELTDMGYRVHVVHPYHVQGTPMWKRVEEGVMDSKGMTWEEADAYNRKDLKMPDLLTADEVADVISILLNEPSLEWTSGTPIELFGGSR